MKMVNNEKVKKGSKITKALNGAQFEEIAYLRKGLWSIIVLAEQDQTKFTQEEINIAKEYQEQYLEHNKRILDLLNR